MSYTPVIEGSLVAFGIIGLTITAIFYSISKPEYRNGNLANLICWLTVALAVLTLALILLMGKTITAISFTVIYILLTFIQPIIDTYVVSTLFITSIVMIIGLVCSLLIISCFSFLPI